MRPLPTLLVLSTLVLAGCTAEAPEPAPEPEAATDTRLAPGVHVWTTADGVSLPYVVAGAGEATVLLVHCWMCDRTFWSNQIPVLAERYRVVALDLPGHGEAGAERTDWTVAGYGADVAGLIRYLDLDDVVLVGHSMGGPVSLKTAALAPGRVRGIVAVDTLHDAEFDFSQIGQFLEAFETDFSGTCSQFVDGMFPEPDAEAIEARVREGSCAESRKDVGLALMRNFGTMDIAAWFSGAGVPIRAINAAEPNPTEVETNRKYADFDAVLVPDVGHYLQMTRPGEFNPLLLDAVAEILSATPREAEAPAP